MSITYDYTNTTYVYMVIFYSQDQHCIGAPDLAIIWKPHPLQIVGGGLIKMLQAPEYKPQALQLPHLATPNALERLILVAAVAIKS